MGPEAAIDLSFSRQACLHTVSLEVAETSNTYPYGFRDGREYDGEMDCLDFLVLDLERLQEKFRHADRFGPRCLARDLGYDGSEELFPNDLRLDSFIKGARCHFHLSRKSIRDP